MKVEECIDQGADWHATPGVPGAAVPARDGRPVDRRPPGPAARLRGAHLRRRRLNAGFTCVHVLRTCTGLFIHGAHACTCTPTWPLPCAYSRTYASTHVHNQAFFSRNNRTTERWVTHIRSPAGECPSNSNPPREILWFETQWCCTRIKCYCFWFTGCSQICTYYNLHSDFFAPKFIEH